MIGRVAPEEEYAWLLGMGEIPSRAPTCAQFDDASRFALRHWQVIGTTGPHVLEWAGKKHEESELALAVRDRIVSVSMLGRLQLVLMCRVARELTSRGIPYVFLKGSATRLVAFDLPSQRGSYDIDIAVPPECVRDAERAILDLGFHQAELDFEKNRFVVARPSLRQSVEAKHYELGFLARRQRIVDMSDAVKEAIQRDIPTQDPWHLYEDGVACFMTIDVHHGLCLDIPSTTIVCQAKQVLYEDTALWVPSTPWLVFHLIYKLYWEGVRGYGKGGYQYADLCRLLAKMSDGDVPPLISLLERHLFEVGAYFVLRRIGPELGGKLPAPLEAFVERMARPKKQLPPVDPVAINDLGDMWSKLWGGR